MKSIIDSLGNIMRTNIGIADLIKVIKILEPTDHETVRRLAQSLGYDFYIERTDQEEKVDPNHTKDISEHESDKENSKEDTDNENDATNSSSEVDTDDETDLQLNSEYPFIYPREKIERNANKSEEFLWLIDAEGAEIEELPESSNYIYESKKKIPLIENNLMRALFFDVLSKSVEGVLPDVDSIISEVSTGLPLIRIPRIVRKTLSYGAVILVDRAESLTPYYEDQEHFITRSMEVVGREKTAVLFFYKNPEDGIRKKGHFEWKTWSPPIIPAPMLVITDFNVQHIWWEQERVSLSPDNAIFWLNFVKKANKAGCPVIFLVPYPEHRWPSVYRDKLAILQWDKILTLRGIKDVIDASLAFIT